MSDAKSMLDDTVLDREALEFAATVCTAKQMEVLRMRSQGMGLRAIGRVLMISTTSVRARLELAVLHLKKAIIERELQDEEERDGKHADVHDGAAH